MTPRRVPFAPGDADAIIAFCTAHGPFDARLCGRLLLELTSDPAGVLVVEDGEGTALVATVVDQVSNSTDAANVETLGVRAPLSAEAFTRLVVEPAIAFVRRGARRGLSVGLHASAMPAADAAGALRDAGFAHAYDTFEMRRPGSTPAETPEPLPAGWSWRALDGSLVEAAHQALTEMFRGAPSTNMVSLADFRNAVATGATVWWALLDGDRVAGLVQIAPHGSRGDLRIVGRAPEYRGRGLGPRLVAEALRMLREGGAGDVDLTVEAENDRALALYRRFGFDVVSRTPVFALTLR
jgi:ribosomal protein S18 acetylase RimI-like enzyme